MKKLRIPLLITALILIIGLILGSFFDLQISQTLFRERNGFGIFMSAFSLIPGYALFSIIGGAMLANSKIQKNKGVRIFLYIIAVIAILASSYLSGKEIFSLNGYNKEGFGYLVLGCAICLVFQAGAFYLGYYLFKNSQNEKLWLALFILVVGLVIALIGGTVLFKAIMNRPRYRLVQTGFEHIKFYNWFERCTNSKGYIALGAAKEDFKSFPSGHAGASMLLALSLAFILPLAKPNLAKYSIWLFIGGVAYSLLVMFTRILVGAHFLSDVSMGGLLVVVFSYIANEVIIHYNLLKLE